MKLSELIVGLNEHEFGAFPQNKGKEKAEDVTRTTVIVKDNDGKRFFLNPVAVGINEDGTAKWGWAKGQEMKPRETQEQAE